MLPTPADLTYFLEVATSLNLSRAAERLGITQPSLTLSMRRLEDALGTQILVRNKKGVTLTQSGKQLYIHARKLLQSWEELKAQTLSSMNEMQGAFVIGCHPSVALYSLSGFLPAMLEAHPLLNLTLRHDLSRKITEGVISSQIDIGIAVNAVQHPDLVISKLCYDEVTLWTGPSKNKTCDLKSERGVLICDPELLQTQSILERLKKQKLFPKRILPSSNLEVIADLTAHGAGVGILPGRVAGIARETLRRVPGAPVFKDEISVLYRVENKGVHTIQTLTEAIRLYFKETS